MQVEEQHTNSEYEEGLGSFKYLWPPQIRQLLIKVSKEKAIELTIAIVALRPCRTKGEQQIFTQGLYEDGPSDKT
jgi:hypothetical protein